MSESDLAALREQLAGIRAQLCEAAVLADLDRANHRELGRVLVAQEAQLLALAQAVERLVAVIDPRFREEANGGG